MWWTKFFSSMPFAGKKTGVRFYVVFTNMFGMCVGLWAYQQQMTGTQLEAAADSILAPAAGRNINLRVCMNRLCSRDRRNKKNEIVQYALHSSVHSSCRYFCVLFLKWFLRVVAAMMAGIMVLDDSLHCCACLCNAHFKTTFSWMFRWIMLLVRLCKTQSHSCFQNNNKKNLATECCWQIVS